MSDPENTTPEMLMAAADIGKLERSAVCLCRQLRDAATSEHHCHNCGTRVVERYGYFIQSYRLTPDGACPKCGTSIPGRWGTSFDGQITSSPFRPGRRRFRTL